MQALLTLIKSSQYRTMPWKNGGGSTTELYIDPPHGAVDTAFSWRISLATINGSGPFSRFPDYKRVIVQLAGPAMSLLHTQEGEHQLQHFVPYRFSGSSETRVELEPGSALDFNLMVHREGPQAELSVHLLPQGHEQILSLGAWAFIYVIEGRVEIAGQQSKGREQQEVVAGNSLLIQDKTKNSAQTLKISCKASRLSRLIYINFTADDQSLV